MSGDGLIDEALLEEAVGIAQEAAELTLKWFQGSGLDVRTKQDGTVVTEADEILIFSRATGQIIQTVTIASD